MAGRIALMTSSTLSRIMLLNCSNGAPPLSQPVPGGGNRPNGTLGPTGVRGRLFPAGRGVRHWRAMAVPNPAPLALVLGHASGFSWDEGLLVMAPLVVIGGLL